MSWLLVFLLALAHISGALDAVSLLSGVQPGLMTVSGEQHAPMTVSGEQHAPITTSPKKHAPVTVSGEQYAPAAVSGVQYAPVAVSGVTVPHYGVEGRHAVLYCSYRSVQPVYSVRWYKNGKEFYSYRPGKLKPITVHPLAGISVVVHQSNIRQVTLSPLSLASTGRYRCEVSEEAPTFATDSKFGDLLVVVVPRRGPRILGASPRYSVGEVTALNCTSEATLPPANLTWYINQQPVEVDQIQIYPVQNTTLEGGEVLHTATLGLSHRLLAADYRGGEVRARCVASIYSAYYQGTEVKLGRRRRRGRKSRDRQQDNSSQGSNQQLQATALPSGALASTPSLPSSLLTIFLLCLRNTLTVSS